MFVPLRVRHPDAWTLGSIFISLSGWKWSGSPTHKAIDEGFMYQLQDVLINITLKCGSGPLKKVNKDCTTL